MGLRKLPQGPVKYKVAGSTAVLHISPTCRPQAIHMYAGLAPLGDAIANLLNTVHFLSVLR